MSKRLVVVGAGGLHGETGVPGDKSISHRALILGALAEGENRVRGWLRAGDTLATLDVVRALGVTVEEAGTTLHFEGGRLQPPERPLDCRNAGTAMRLLAGLLTGQPFPSVLDGSPQLRARPMGRIVEPLRAMGADITATEGRAPLDIRPGRLHGIRYELPVASAQVKSAVILAALQAEGVTEIVEPGPARDHTERMLQAMGADLQVGEDGIIRVCGGRSLRPLDMTIPGDISSAAFLIVAALLLPDSKILLRNIGLNPTRTGLLDILEAMGASFEYQERHRDGGEEVGTFAVRNRSLRAVRIAGDHVVRAIDELPIIAVAATQADGRTEIRDAAELRVKEVDRIALLAQELRKLGAQIEELPDGMLIDGPVRLRGAAVDGRGDHRLAMALVVAGLLAEGETTVGGAEAIEDSFPGFVETMKNLGAPIRRM